MKYKVLIEESYRAIYEIEANSEDEAHDYIDNAVSNGVIDATLNSNADYDRFIRVLEPVTN
jgi:hypothetical protein